MGRGQQKEAEWKGKGKKISVDYGEVSAMVPGFLTVVSDLVSHRGNKLWVKQG